MQVLVHAGTGKEFLRIADDRGWAQRRDPVDDTILFEEINGELTEDA